MPMIDSLWMLFLKGLTYLIWSTKKKMLNYNHPRKKNIKIWNLFVFLSEFTAINKNIDFFIKLLPCFSLWKIRRFPKTSKVGVFCLHSWFQSDLKLYWVGYNLILCWVLFGWWVMGDRNKYWRMIIKSIEYNKVLNNKK